MNINKSLSHLIPAVVLIAMLPLCGFTIVAYAQSTSSEPSSTPGSQRSNRLANMIPAHLPIKVKVNNGESENWEDGFSVEVTNTSAKPIYFLELYLVMPDVKSAKGNQTGFSLRYGRGALIDFSTPLETGDVPIQPGETYTFKLPESSVKGWKGFKAKNNIKPKRLHLIFAQINYGDGTGFNGTDGMPVPAPRRACNEDLKRTYYGKILSDQLNQPQFLQTATLLIAPSFSLVFFET